MSINLRNLPDHKELEDMTHSYTDMDVDAIEARLLLTRVALNAMAVSEAYLAGLGLSEGKCSLLALLHLSPAKKLAPSELAEKMVVTRGTVTGLLDSLEQAGLIKRQPHVDDRRMLTVCLTSRGDELLQRVLPDYFRYSMRMMSALNSEEVAQLMNLLRKVDATVRHLL
ncbi:MarR family transcriptional regulator [Ktedonosporobacter rubrisoli]|uniref:MarR family transcriptional regulator n=1 Tax=Ktedonosporobacter rubrisoli TaxID=2509675 RepID=A0A4P6JRA8_KTERU|nr:MarR family transcriptional regulator [Ktedonosporobacter rubrisoli]QBD77864.1 MarR family transcriptional regulator [Ktedonosporobacter rubrisoli]